MAKETVQAVRQAELNAAQIEKDADAKCEAIVLKAQEDAKILIATKTKEALLMADRNRKQAQQEGAELIESADLQAQLEIQLLRERVKNKEQTAINLVLSEII